VWNRPLLPASIIGAPGWWSSPALRGWRLLTLCAKARAMAEYLAKHGLEGVLEGIVNDVLSEQPQNPFQAMAERLAAAAKAKTGKDVGGGGGAKAAAPAAAAAAADAGDADAVEAALVEALASGTVPDSIAFAAAQGLPHQVFVDRVLKGLRAAEQIVTESTEVLGWDLTAEGAAAAENGSPEFLVWSAVPAGGISRKELEAALDANLVKNGMNQAMKLKLLKVNKQTKNIEQASSSAADATRDVLKSVAAGATLDAKVSKELARRKLIAKTKTLKYSVSKGPKYGVKDERVTTLTDEMLRTGDWKTVEFKPYNLEAAGKMPMGGFLHPLMKVRTQFREVFLELGFEEMPTDRFVESSFWNFDSLFQPQQHPARDAHDTFFTKGAAGTTTKLPEGYFQTVKATHEHGGDTGSIGYKMIWSEEESKKNLLRTHTTAISSRMLYRVAQEMKETGVFRPRKFFSVDRVFRNETMDATHLCEFHQCEGVVLDYNLTLGDLMGTIDQFFTKIGLPGLRFKPAYNPYTEPSMEIFGYHPQLKKSVELGNSGMFRPEMMLPYPLPPDVRAIAWGLSLERPTMILYGISNIRTLFGHEVSIDMIRDNPICRLTV
jgi:phenylalanyl-tRNA synthetase alpha chain